MTPPSRPAGREASEAGDEATPDVRKPNPEGSEAAPDVRKPNPEGSEAAPDVSVVLPVFNEAAHLGAEIDRITAALEASDYTWELLVVDDGSTDGSGDLALGRRGVRLLRSARNLGTGSARRIGTLAARGRVEAFALGTRLTRLTRELSSRDPDRALRDSAEAVLDWSGGTRLGAGLGRFNDEWGCRGMARGAVAVILSDGWDRGEPAEMAEQMRRLSRVAHRVVWVNPLKATPGYRPLARGMAAALPYVDLFVEGHNLDSLERLAALIMEDGAGGGGDLPGRGGPERRPGLSAVTGAGSDLPAAGSGEGGGGR